MACDMGDGLGCAYVGFVIIHLTSENMDNLRSKTISNKLSEAKYYISKGCELGSDVACHTLKEMFSNLRKL